MKRRFFQYAGLNILGSLGMSGCILADTLFISRRLGAGGLAALNLAIPAFGLLNGLGLMLGVGGATRYAICLQQGREQEARRTFTRAVIWGGGAGVALALMGAVGAEWLAALLGAEGTALTMAAAYLRTVLLFAPCFLLNHIFAAFVRNDGAPRLAMAAMLSGSLSNIALDWLFLCPMELGLAGAALATALAPAVGMAVSAVRLHSRRSRLRLLPIVPRRRALTDLAGLGGAALLNECASGLVLALFNLLLLRLAGELGVAAYGIVANLSLTALALFTGLAQGVQPLLSEAHGRGDAAGVRALSRLALRAALAAGVVLAALALLWTEPLVALFNRAGEAGLQRMAESGLRLYCLGLPLAGLNLVAAALLGASERTGRSLGLALLRGCGAAVPAALVLAWMLGLHGVWLAFPAAEGMVLCLSLRYSRPLRRGTAQA